MATFMERVAPIVDDTITALARAKFIEDPIAGSRHSRNTSIMSSAYKRHGKILEAALRESLKESNRHKVWHDDKFRISRAADALVGAQSEEQCRHSELPYGDKVRTIQVDMIAFDHADGVIRAYEVKRGNGQFDSGKIRSTKRDLLCLQLLLRSYGEVSGVKPSAGEAKIVFYYGLRSIPAPWSLTKSDLDHHFGFPVVERVEEANEYFRSKLHELLEAA